MSTTTTETVQASDLASQLKSLLDELIVNPEAAKTLTKEQLEEARKAFSPYAGIIPAPESWINISICNTNNKYIERFTMTSLIAYLYRTLYEYDPREPANENDKPRQMSLEEVRKEKEIITRFLNRNFNYNPDRHVRGSHTANAGDPDRRPKLDMIRASMQIGSAAVKPTKHYEAVKDATLRSYQSSLLIAKTLRKALGLASNGSLSREELVTFLAKNVRRLEEYTAELQKVAEPLAVAESIAALKIDPPADVYHHFTRYVTNHYEQLREAVEALYHEKPDIEYLINYISQHKNEKDAREFRIKHNSNFRADVLTIRNGCITLLGPFKENRERVDFYNKNTEVIKMMAEQIDLDHKLGKDMMDKSISRKKKQNIMESGPDAPGLAAYTKALNTIESLGAKKGLTDEEAKQLAEAKLEKEMAEVPEGAIMTEVLFPDQRPQDELLGALDVSPSLKREIMYTQAEAPVHLEKDSTYVDKYQPKRADPTDMRYEERTYTTKSGKVKKVTEPAAH